MAQTSVALAVLSAIEAVLPEARALYLQAGAQGIMSFEIIIGELKALEALCETRVEATQYQAHRRALEACHVATELPAARHGG